MKLFTATIQGSGYTLAYKLNDEFLSHFLVTCYPISDNCMEYILRVPDQIYEILVSGPGISMWESLSRIQKQRLTERKEIRIVPK